jgi:HD-GYP domain-containing protein (c-di-GMP phosphodiesterase class II)
MVLCRSTWGRTSPLMHQGYVHNRNRRGEGVHYKEIPYRLACINGKSSIDLYFKVKDAYRLFAAEGASFTEDHYRMCNKVTLYIQSEDHVAAEEALDDHVRHVLTDSTIDPKIKGEIAYFFTMRSLRKVFEGTNARTIENLHRISKSIATSLLRDRSIVGHVMDMTSIDHYVLQHSVKTGTFGLALSINLLGEEMSEDDLTDLGTAFFLHDIGMTKIPRSVVDKEDPLTPSEWEVIRKHPIWGHDKLSKACRLSDKGASVVLYHHERCNGSGYPFMLSGNDIPVVAKACAIADTFESLTSQRPFRPSKTPFEALRIMQIEMANEFDHDLFRAFIMLLGPGS